MPEAVLTKRRRYPFGGGAPFLGLNILDADGKKALLKYRPTAKQALVHNCCCDEILFGGSMYPGKTYGLLNHNAAHCLRWGPDAETIIFRRTYDELRRSVVPEMIRLFHDKVGKMRGADDQPVFRWDNGAVTWLRHLQDWDDVLKHDSAQYTEILFEELTHFEEQQYLYMFQRNRTPRNLLIQPQMLASASPGGIGHRWVWDRFIKDKEPQRIYAYKTPAVKVGDRIVPERLIRRIFIFAVATDNTAAVDVDQYIANCKANMSDLEFRAKILGDWTAFSGLAFPEWETETHVVDDFQIPKDWKTIRALDYGYDDPFSMGWYATNPNNKRIFRIAEWYGATKGKGGGEKGLHMPPGEVRAEILAREEAALISGAFPRPWWGVSGPDTWSKKGVGCVADDLNAGGVLFRPWEVGPGSRVRQKLQFHALLRIQPATGKPGFASFKSCTAFNEQVPKLILSRKDPNDVDKEQPDHAYHECKGAINELLKGGSTTRAEMNPRYLREYGKKRVPL